MSDDEKSLSDRQTDLKARMEAQRAQHAKPKHTHAPKQRKAPKPIKIDPPRVAEEEEYDWHQYPENGIRELRTQKGIRAPDLAGEAWDFASAFGTD
jgi:hypothetical protein